MIHITGNDIEIVGHTRFGSSLIDHVNGIRGIRLGDHHIPGPLSTGKIAACGRADRAGFIRNIHLTGKLRRGVVINILCGYAQRKWRIRCLRRNIRQREMMQVSSDHIKLIRLSAFSRAAHSNNVIRGAPGDRDRTAPFPTRKIACHCWRNCPGIFTQSCRAGKTGDFVIINIFGSDRDTERLSRHLGTANRSHAKMIEFSRIHIE